MAEAPGLGAGVDDVRAVGEPVDDSSKSARDIADRLRTSATTLTAMNTQPWTSAYGDGLLDLAEALS